MKENAQQISWKEKLNRFHESKSSTDFMKEPAMSCWSNGMASDFDFYKQNWEPWFYTRSESLILLRINGIIYGGTRLLTAQVCSCF
jgi:hypothetical protein